MDLRSLRTEFLKLGPKLNAFPKRELIVWKLITDLGMQKSTEVRAMVVPKSWKGSSRGMKLKSYCMLW